MKRIVIALTLFAIMSIAVIAELYPEYKTPLVSPRPYGLNRGVERVTNYDPRVNFIRLDATVYLSPPGVDVHTGAGRGGYAPLYSRGAARVQSSAWYGFPRAEVNLKTKDLQPSANENVQYEAWLVDQDTGYRLSLGTFTTAFGGVGELFYRTDNYFDPYDYLEITVEPGDDMDPIPGPVVLIGRIPSTTIFDPAPKSAKMVTPTFRTY